MHQHIDQSAVFSVGPVGIIGIENIVRVDDHVSIPATVTSGVGSEVIGKNTKVAIDPIPANTYVTSNACHTAGCVRVIRSVIIGFVNELHTGKP